MRHVVGTPAEQDVVVYEEPDEKFWLGVGLTRSERYIGIELGSKITSEFRLLPADTPLGEFRVVRERETGVEYSVDHWAHPDDASRDVLFIVHNAEGRENFELATAPIDEPGWWTPLIPHDPAVRLVEAEAFAGHFVVSYRKDGLTGVAVHPFVDGVPSATGTPIAFEEPIYTVGTGGNPEYHADRLRLGYASLVTPSSVYDYTIATGELTLLKRTPVLGGFDPDQYEQRRVWATAEDGTKVPVSVVHRKGLVADGTAPCLLYGYGSYEASIDPYFSVARLSLLDRGFVYAIAHIRGGGELGRTWYEQGKLLHKRNTFTDFVAAGRAMVEQGWSAPDRLIARGGSAGGLLMGAVANLAPELWRGVLAEVPFVDALNTILDPSLPLTVMEWEEWGNPLESAEVYSYMKSYSPYENVAAVRYPSILVRTSVNDTRVGYHEPAKWVARLRATALNGATSDILLKTDMDAAGHGGKSGRYDAWRQEAFALAWVCATAGAVGESAQEEAASGAGA
jgi:oligopeptidase B